LSFVVFVAFLPICSQSPASFLFFKFNIKVKTINKLVYGLVWMRITKPYQKCDVFAFGQDNGGHSQNLKICPFQIYFSQLTSSAFIPFCSNRKVFMLVLRKEIVLAIACCSFLNYILPVAILLWFYFVDDVKWCPSCLPKFGKACFLCYFLSSLFACLCSQRRTVISQRIWDAYQGRGSIAYSSQGV